MKPASIPEAARGPTGVAMELELELRRIASEHREVRVQMQDAERQLAARLAKKQLAEGVMNAVFTIGSGALGIAEIATADGHSEQDPSLAKIGGGFWDLANKARELAPDAAAQAQETTQAVRDRNAGMLREEAEIQKELEELRRATSGMGRA